MRHLSVFWIALGSVLLATTLVGPVAGVQVLEIPGKDEAPEPQDGEGSWVDDNLIIIVLVEVAAVLLGGMWLVYYLRRRDQESTRNFWAKDYVPDPEVLGVENDYVPRPGEPGINELDMPPQSDSNDAGQRMEGFSEPEA